MPPTAYLDDTPFPINPGETILDFAWRTGHHNIPTLCHVLNFSLVSTHFAWEREKGFECEPNYCNFRISSSK
uniref:Uncharacterized protein n=1 Tax=Candidatus Kentrum sp. LFY TaxID=2126342 RepID=A0A450W8Q6_9GAMM|nr:MAG: hypothetical protein BECKLFY1418C_GA0070996_100335 [Candidatus Kentron sp. LFY]